MRPDDVLDPIFSDLSSNKCFIKKPKGSSPSASVADELDMPDAVLLGCFPVEVIESIQESIRETQHCLLESVPLLHDKVGFQVSRISSSISQLTTEVSNNWLAVFSVLATQSESKERHLVRRIASNSTSISTLGILMSILRGDDERTTRDIGLAGLLHDVSLLLNPEWFSLVPSARTETARRNFRSHALVSASLLEGLPGLSESLFRMIREVHEQSDGTGYPFGKSEDKLSPGSLILNLADAFVSLTSPVSGIPKVAADAMALLCFHTSQGAFSRSVFQLFLDSVSIYPVGSVIVLDNNEDAVVIQANEKKPLQPVVRMLQRGNQEIDLSQSELQVAELANAGTDTKANRIKKSEVKKALWRSELDISRIARNCIVYPTVDIDDVYDAGGLTHREGL